MRIYCPTCWQDFDDRVERCPTCGTSLHDWSGGDYVAKLIRALGHPEPDTVARAATILGRIGGQRAADPLLKLLAETGDAEAVVAAARSLAALGERRAIPLLARRLADPRSFITVRLAAVESLGALGGAEATQAIASALHDSSAAVREYAAQYLRQHAVAAGDGAPAR